MSNSFVAEPLTLKTDKTLPNPYYLPNGTGCQQSIRLNTTGGYAPITWSLVDPTTTMDKWSLAPVSGVVEPASAPPATGSNALLKKPSGPTSRLLKFAAVPTSYGFSGGTVTVRVTDGSGTTKTLALNGIRLTQACGTPSIGVISQNQPSTTNGFVDVLKFGIQVSQFHTGDNTSGNLISRIQCEYPNGVRLLCQQGINTTTVGGGYQLEQKAPLCAPDVPCAFDVPNLTGSGSVVVRLVNPYGASAPATVTATFPSRTFAETELFYLPASISSTPATVTGSLDSAGNLGSAAPSCGGGYLVWRNVTFSDPSGRAKFSRTVKPGEVVSAASMPQWAVTPGAAQISLQVTYEVERRRTLCQALVIN